MLLWPGFLAKPAVSSVIVGRKNSEQLEENLAALDLELTSEDMASLDAVAPLPPEYPMTMQASAAADRLPKSV